jgi:hypothetical protein
MRGERVKRTKWRDKKSERDDGEKKISEIENIRSERHDGEKLRDKRE